MATRSGCQPGCGGAGGMGTCEEILEGCIQPSLAPPLFYDPASETIRLCISDEEGNGLRLDQSGQCLYSDSAGTPPPDQGRKTIANLPAFIFAANLCGQQVNPQGSPSGVEHAIANNIDIIDNWSQAAADRVAMWTPFNSGTALSTYTTSPSAGGIQTVTSAEATGLLSDAGNPYEPVSQRSGAPSADKPTGRDQNWYGWSTATWHLRTTQTMLREINARAVTNLRCNTSTDVAPTIAAVAQAGAQDSAMIQVFTSDLAQVTSITSAGMTALVNIDRDTTTTPAAVVASGATWVAIYWMQTDERVASFVAAGLQVILVTDSTHFQTARAQTLGCRGVNAADPVYARGQLGTAAALAYRHPILDWQGKGTRYGTITRRTSDYRIVDGRGFTVNGTDGIGMEAQFQWTNSTTPIAYAQMLLGELCPLPNPTAFQLDWGLFIRGSQPTQNFCKSGVFFGFNDDRDFAIASAGTEQPGVNGYHAFVRPGSGSDGGELVIGKITNGLYTELAASTTKLNWGVNIWGSLRLVVTASQITFTRIRTNDSYSVSVADGDYRGPYLKVSKEEATGSGGTFQAFTNNWTYQAG